MSGRHPAQIPGHGKDRDAAGNDSPGSNPGQSAENNIFPLAVIHAEIRTGGARGGEEADGDQQCIQKTGQRIGVRRLVMGDTAAVGPQDDQHHQERNPVHELGQLGDVIDAL